MTKEQLDSLLRLGYKIAWMIPHSPPKQWRTMQLLNDSLHTWSAVSSSGQPYDKTLLERRYQNVKDYGDSFVPTQEV